MEFHVSEEEFSQIMSILAEQPFHRVYLLIDNLICQAEGQNSLANQQHEEALQAMGDD